MIAVEVKCNGRSDHAEADTPEGAIVAARCMYDEHGERGWSFPITTTFRVGGVVVATQKGRRP